MKNFLIIFFLIFNLSLFGQNKYLFDSKASLESYKTNDTIIYFDFKDTCSLNTKSSIIDSLLTMTMNVDTLADNRYQIEYYSNNKSNILTFFQNLNSIKCYSYEYLDNKSIINWTSDKIILEIKEEINIDSILNQLKVSYTLIERDSIIPKFFYVTINKNMDPFETSNLIYSTGNFVTVRPSFFFKIMFFGYEDNPLYNNQLYLRPYIEELYLYKGINVVNAWDITTGDPNIKIAVLDNGVRKTHQDFANNITGGFDATYTPLYGLNLEGDCVDWDTHGTQVAGIIGAENNSIGIVGIAHTSKILPIRMAVSYRDYHNGDYTDWWYSNPTYICRAFQHCIDKNVDVVNGSWGSATSSQIDYLLNEMATNGRNGKGMALVFAAGNYPTSDFYLFVEPEDIYLGQRVFYPAINDNTICVGGIDYDGYWSGYNCGEGLDIVAPANYIQTTTIPSTLNPTHYRLSQGTSMAAPQVSAIIALMLSVNPELTYNQIKEILYTTTKKVPLMIEDQDPSFQNFPYGSWDITSGYGLINAHAAVFESAFYGIPMVISELTELELCSETIISISEFDVPDWVDSVNWIMGDNVLMVEQISPFSIKVKTIGVGNAAVSFNIYHKNYTKTIRKSFIVTSSENIIYNSYEFTGNHNITNTALISGENIVKENCILTINSSIKCTPNASIIVKPGGKLIVNNGELTNYCEDYPWKGIIVEGNPFVNQVGNNPNQGALILEGAIIANAECAVKIGNFYTSTISGGYINASNSYFQNNRISIFFSSYKNIFNGTELINRSTFTNCNFEVNNDFLNENLSFYSHIYLQGVYGIPFKGCSFSSTLTTAQSPNEFAISRIGIKSFNSSFSVKPICGASLLLGEVCENITQPSIFSGLNYGIVATSSNNLSNIEINSTGFVNNDYGIYISGVNNPKILKNIFEIGKSSNTITGAPVGIHIQNSTGFRIEENRFTKNELNSYEHIGLYLKNSGTENNQIYKNNFDNLYIGQYLDGSNYSTLDSYYGLISLCNENSSNFKRDFIIGTNPSERYNGINMYQSGLNNSGNVYLRKAAGNSFTLTPNIDMQYENTTGRMINYYFDPQGNSAEPTEYFDIITIPASENICPTKINAIIPSTIELELTSVTLEFSNLKYNYNQLMDAGNTNEMLQLIQGEWSEDIWDLRTELLGESPYLSQEVLISVAAENLLPQAIYLEICIANPDATKDESFLDFLRYDIPNPLSEYMIEIIIASWDEETIRTELEGKLAAFKLMTDELHNKKTELMFEDSYIHHDELISHLESRGMYSDYLTLAEISIAQNDDYNQASNYIDFIENNIGKLTEDQADEIESFREYLLILDSLNRGGKTIYNLDSIQISKLVEYAVKDNYRGAILTRNILCMLYNICLNDVQAPPKKLRVNPSSSNSNGNIPFIASVNVIPNPASTYTTFEWNLKSFDKNAILTIYDQVGKVLLTKEINSNQGQWVWDTRSYGNGVYVYILKSDKLILNSGKVVINK